MSAKGEPVRPPLALFRALLVAMRHDLSDVRPAEAVDNRASFRRLCGFAAHEPTPGRMAFARFRAGLVRRRLGRSLFEAVRRPRANVHDAPGCTFGGSACAGSKLKAATRRA